MQDRPPRLLDWDREYFQNFGVATRKSLSQDGITYDMDGIEILDGTVEQPPYVAPVPKEPKPPVELFEVPAYNDRMDVIRDAYEKHVGKWSELPGAGYTKRRNAIVAMREKLDELLLEAE